MSQFIVLLTTGRDRHHAYGPIADREMAQRFANFLTKEVDPAIVMVLTDPLDEVLAEWRNRTRDETRPNNWPPTVGSVWRDRDAHLWICTQTPKPSNYLFCITKLGDDSAEEIWRLHGPLTFFTQVTSVSDEEPPF